MFNSIKDVKNDISSRMLHFFRRTKNMDNLNYIPAQKKNVIISRNMLKNLIKKKLKFDV